MYSVMIINGLPKQVHSEILNYNMHITQFHILLRVPGLSQLTSRHDALQPDDVWVVKLSHDGGLGQEVPPLFVRVSRLQALDGHVDLPLSLNTQPTTANLPKLSYTHTHTKRR